MLDLNVVFGSGFSFLMGWFLAGFYLLFALLYIIYSIVYLNIVKVLNNTVKTPYAWFFDFFRSTQLLKISAIPPAIKFHIKNTFKN